MSTPGPAMINIIDRSGY